MIDTHADDSGRPAVNPLIHFAAEETVSPGGVILPATGSVRAWIKLKGEPAQVFAETPLEFMNRWEEFGADSSQRRVVFHEYNTGVACYFMRPALAELAYVQISFQTAPPARVRPGSYWLKQCPCEVCETKRG
jgi:hypothetical protein